MPLAQIVIHSTSVTIEWQLLVQLYITLTVIKCLLGSFFFCLLYRLSEAIFVNKNIPIYS
jgi:hypothetical protein